MPREPRQFPRRHWRLRKRTRHNHGRGISGRLRHHGGRDQSSMRMRSGGRGCLGDRPVGVAPVSREVPGSVIWTRGSTSSGFASSRRQRRGTTRSSVYTYPSKKALLSIMVKVRALTKREQHHGLADLLGRLNPVLRGWCAYFRHGVSKATFGYLTHLLGIGSPSGCSSDTNALPGRSATRDSSPQGRGIARHGRDHHVRRDHGAGNPIPLAREQYPHTMGQQHRDLGSCVTVAVRGEPDAVRVARPVVCPSAGYVEAAADESRFSLC